MSIRARLVWLVIAVIAPLLVFALYVIYSVYLEQSRQVDQGMQETTRAVALAVDRELARYREIVTTLAASPTIINGDLRSFHERMQQTRHPLGAGVTIFNPDGIPLANSEYPYGVRLPMPPSLPGLPNSLPLDVSPLFRDPVTRAPSIAIHRPVMRNDEVVYYVTMKFPVTGIAALLEAQGLPERWLGLILDQTHIIVARSRQIGAEPGSRASSGLVDKLRTLAMPDGKISATSDMNQQVTSFFSRTQSSDWTVVIEIRNSPE